jgi:hypothetical protein
LFQAVEKKDLSEEKKRILVDYMESCDFGFLPINKENLPFITQEIILHEVI